MQFTFTVTAEVSRVQGKFATREDLAQQIQDELEGANPGDLTGENDGEYTVDTWDVAWDVEEQPEPPRKQIKRNPRSKNAKCVCGFTWQEHNYGRRKCAAGKFIPKGGEA